MEWTADEWHRRADESMKMAENASDPGVKAIMYMITQRYCELAGLAEQKAAKRADSNPD